MTSSDCPAISSSLHPLITQNLVDTSKYYCPFLDRGFCRDKTKCNFSHERNHSIKVPLDYCHFYLANRCLYGVECKFQHIEPLNSILINTTSNLSAGSSSSTRFNSANVSNLFSDCPNQTNSTDRPSTSSSSSRFNGSITSNNHIDSKNRDKLITNPPTNSADLEDVNNHDGEVDHQNRFQPFQFAHHSQYWYHPIVPSSSTNTCPFLGGLDKSDYHNKIPDQNSQKKQFDDNVNNYMQMQANIYHHNQGQNIYNPYDEFLPQRLGSSLPSLSFINSYDHNQELYEHDHVNINNQLMESYDTQPSSSQLDTDLQQEDNHSNDYRFQQINQDKVNDENSIETWTPVARFCRRHSIGHIDMISDEHLLLSCDLCGQRCLQPADQEQQRAHRDECLRELEQEMELSFAIQRSKDKVCGICMDVVVEKKPVTSSRFGILEKCNHIFCLDCIRKWRGTKQFENRTIR